MDDTPRADLPSLGVPPEAWDRAHEELVRDLRSLIRIASVNPPGGELAAARVVADLLADLGLRPEVLEPFPDRGSVACRLRGDGSGGRPLLLLSHLDVVPAPLDGWTHDPFAADVADGYVWGRGAVDMKAMVAMEIGVLRRLVAEARAAGRDPASDPIPGLRRDVLFASTADEEAGGGQGAGWIVDHRPDLLDADVALNEAGGVSMTFAGRRFYPIQVAEKGLAVYRLTVHGMWGHGSMPRQDNAAVRAALVIARLAEPGRPRPSPVVRRFVEAAATALPPDEAALVGAILDPDPVRSSAAVDRLCEEPYRRAANALLRDSINVGVVHGGVKYNVVPGRAEIEIDCRVLPDTTEERMRDEVIRRIGTDLADHVDVELVFFGAPVESPQAHSMYGLVERILREHDPQGTPVPAMAPFATDAKHLVRLDIPTYGFSPLRVDRDERFLERFHGIDERVGLDALRFGLPVLYDVVRVYCG